MRNDKRKSVYGSIPKFFSIIDAQVEENKSFGNQQTLDDLSEVLKVDVDELQNQMKRLRKYGLGNADEIECLSDETIEILNSINMNPTARGLSDICNVSTEEIIDLIYMNKGFTVGSQNQPVEKEVLVDVLAEIKRNPIKGKKLIIDGMNICWVDEIKISLKYLLSLVLSIIDNEGEFICIFDSQVKKRFRKTNPNELNNISRLLCDVGEYFRVCTRDEEADEPIIKLAKKKHHLIICNDNYEKYQANYPWIGRGAPRLKKINISKGPKTKQNYLEVRDLNLRTSVREDVKSMMYEIIAKLKLL